MSNASSPTSPALRRLELAASLRKHRRSAGLTTVTVTQRLGISASKLSRIETGARPIRIEDLHALCDLYSVDQAEREYLSKLVGESRQASEWKDRETTNRDQTEFLELEQVVSTLDDYKSTSITALLQTQAYMRGLFQALSPHLPHDEIAEQISDRVYRQQHVLNRERSRPLRFLMDEAALWREVGGPATMRAQLNHLADLTTESSISIAVIPFSAGAHIGINSLFTILSFDQPVRDRVYIDGLMGPTYFADTRNVARYRGHFEQLWNDALGPTATRDLIHTVRKHL